MIQPLIQEYNSGAIMIRTDMKAKEKYLVTSMNWIRQPAGGPQVFTMKAEEIGCIH